jgi:hypothetical protein
MQKIPPDTDNSEVLDYRPLGYADPTAAQAITNLERAAKRKPRRKPKRAKNHGYSTYTPPPETKRIRQYIEGAGDALNIRDLCARFPDLAPLIVLDAVDHLVYIGAINKLPR